MPSSFFIVGVHVHTFLPLKSIIIEVFAWDIYTIGIVGEIQSKMTPTHFLLCASDHQFSLGEPCTLASQDQHLVNI